LASILFFLAFLVLNRSIINVTQGYIS
jgi:hypothetical protein